MINIGKKSRPEWGLNISRKNMAALQPYRFDLTIEHLRGSIALAT